jgi:hypothetical protein
MKRWLMELAEVADTMFGFVVVMLVGERKSVVLV